MQDKLILEIIDNLKGRKNYEQKKAAKLGFTSLYAYFEDKVSKQKNITETQEKASEKNVVVVKLFFYFLFFFLLSSFFQRQLSFF